MPKRTDTAANRFALHEPKDEREAVMNLTHKRYFFELTNGPSVILADLPKMNLSPGAQAIEACVA